MTIELCKSAISNSRKVFTSLERYLNGVDGFLSIAGPYSKNEILELILGAIRANDFSIVEEPKPGKSTGYKVDTDKIQNWIKEKLVPNTVVINIEDEDVLKLLVFSLAMAYKMFRGETFATRQEKVRVSKSRDFEQIFSDQFIGKIGEVVFKKFIKNKFKGVEINLDWAISKDPSRFKSDILNSKKSVSIKSSNTLRSVCAESPKEFSYGVFIKVAIPIDFFLKILAHISSLYKFLSFLKDKLAAGGDTSEFSSLIEYIGKIAYEEELVIKGFVCGYFKPGPNNLCHKGVKLRFIGYDHVVYEDKHVLPYSELKWSIGDWKSFINSVL